MKQEIIERVVNITECGNLKKLFVSSPSSNICKKTRLRVVYDASLEAKKGDNSLNDCLYRRTILFQISVEFCYILDSILL